MPSVLGTYSSGMLVDHFIFDMNITQREIITIVDNQEYRRLTEYVKKTDPKAFVTVYAVSHIQYQPQAKS